MAIGLTKKNGYHSLPRFYSHDAVFLENVTHFIGAALKNGNAAIVFATKPHRDSLLQGLKTQGVDVDVTIQQGAYVSLDAADTLSTFMVNGWPDADRFFIAIYPRRLPTVPKPSRVSRTWSKGISVS
jgi:hypothetical protein